MQRRRRQLVVGAVSALAAPALFFGKSYAATPRAVLRTAWWSDPFARGSYSHLGLHGTRADRAQLAQPVAERLVFAGEATEPDYPSTVHGAILSGRRAADQIRDLGVDHVAIIGAGVAGLAAAELLLRDGIAVDLLEARARIGGRVITDRSLGFGADLGASWIHGSHANPVTEIAHALGLTLLRSDWEGVVTRNREGRSVDMPEWLLWHSIANLDYADDYDNLSDLALDEGEEFGGPDVMISGGYDQILAGFETDGVRLHLASPIVQITYGTGGVEIVTAAGSNSGTLTAQAAIVTLPLGVLQSGAVQFAPSLPPEVQASLSRLRMGSLEKVVLHYDHAFWDQGAEVILAADARDGAFAAFVNLLPLTGQAALMALNGGDYARSLAGLSTEVLGQRASAALAALYP